MMNDPRDIPSLFPEYDQDLVVGQYVKLGLESLSQHADKVEHALIEGSVADLMSIDSQAVQVLYLISTLDESDVVESVFRRTNMDSNARTTLKSLWETAREHLDIWENVRKINPDFIDEFVIPENVRKELQDRLEALKPDIESRQRRALLEYEDVLQSLQSSYLSGDDVAEQLLSLSRVSTFRECLDLLTKSVRMVDTLTESPVSGVSEFARKYMPLALLWGQVRLVGQGRVNTWTGLDARASFDVERRYPQLEMRIYSADKQILYMKDDVDDVVQLAIRMLAACQTTVQSVHESGLVLSDTFVRDMYEYAEELEKRCQALRQSLENARGAAR